MIPNLKDLVLYVNKKITGLDWNTNWQKLINWLTAGTSEIKVKSIEISQDGGIINNGTTQQNGNFDINGDLSVGGNVSSSGVFSGDGSGLYNLTSAKMFPYAPWSINSGNKDAEGNGDLISATAITSDDSIIGYTIEFKVGNTYEQIGATTAKGEHFTIASLSSDTISSANTETFYFIKKGELFTTKLENIKIFRQKTAPTGSDVVNNYIWLDTSQETLICRKYSSGDAEWQEWDYVPLGKVTTTSLSETPTIETFPFNQNEYSVNSYSKVITIIYDKATKYPNYAAGYQVAYSTNNTPAGWTATADGWIKGIIAGNGVTADDTWLRINNVDIVRASRSGLGYFVIGLLPVKEGDYIEVRNGATATFYPNR